MRQHWMSQLAEAKGMYDRVKSHPIMEYQWSQRIKEAENKLKEAKDAPESKSVTLSFSGSPVDGTHGIELKFALDVMEPYQEMIKSEFSAGFHGQIGERGPRRSDTEARLYLTDLPRGSVGLELTPANATDLLTYEYLEGAFSKVGNVIRAAATDDEAYANAALKISGRTLLRLRDFFKTLAMNDVSMDIEKGMEQTSLTQTQIKEAWERVGSSLTESTPIQLPGVFNGAMVDSWRFDFRPDAGEAIFGEIAEDIKLDTLADWNKLTTKRAVAFLNKIIFTPKNGEPKFRYEMTDLKE